MKKHCDRCRRVSRTLIMSKFNTEMICMPCKGLERSHPGYPAANAAELAAIRRGEMNFPGIGCPPGLREQSCEQDACKVGD